MLDWANGDARIVEGETNNYSLSFKTWDGSAVSTALRLDGDNTATFTGTIKQTGKTLTIEANDPEIVLKDTDEGTDDKVFRIINVSEELRFTARNDDNSANADGGDVLKITRSGNATFAGNVDIFTGDSSATINIGSNSSERLTIYQDDNHTTLTADNDSDGDGNRF